MAGGSPRLVLFGPPGTGKTHVAVGLYRWAVFRSGDVAGCVFVDVPEYCRGTKKSFDGLPEGRLAPADWVDPARRFVAIDDLFGKELKEYEINVIVPELIMAAHRNDAPCIVTMNYTLAEARRMLNPHEVDRLVHGAELVEFGGKSYRPGDRA